MRRLQVRVQQERIITIETNLSDDGVTKWLKGSNPTERGAYVVAESGGEELYRVVGVHDESIKAVLDMHEEDRAAFYKAIRRART